MRAVSAKAKTRPVTDLPSYPVLLMTCLVAAAAILIGHTAAWGQAEKTRAEFAILIDGESGSVLYEKNADEPMAPASMSKLMTMVIAFEALKAGETKLEDKFYISERAFKMGGSRMFAKLKDEIQLQDLIQGVIVQSGNDASVAIAEGLSGTEEAFAEEMNTRAKELGMSRSNFVNATGWPHPDHYTTARDLATVARHIIYGLADFYPFYAQKSFTWNKIKQNNRNPLIYMNIGADGLKTGHTEESGYGLVASAKRAGRRLILVINGVKTKNQRAEEARKLIDWGFRSFRQYVVFEKDSEIGKARIWGGEDNSVSLVAKEPVALLLTRSGRKKLKAQIVYTGPLRAPLKKGQEVAKLRILTSNKIVNEVPLVAAKDVPEGGIIGRAIDTLKFMVIGG